MPYYKDENQLIHWMTEKLWKAAQQIQPGLKELIPEETTQKIEGKKIEIQSDDFNVLDKVENVNQKPRYVSTRKRPARKKAK